MEEYIVLGFWGNVGYMFCVYKLHYLVGFGSWSSAGRLLRHFLLLKWVFRPFIPVVPPHWISTLGQYLHLAPWTLPLQSLTGIKWSHSLHRFMRELLLSILGLSLLTCSPASRSMLSRSLSETIVPVPKEMMWNRKWKINPSRWFQCHRRVYEELLWYWFDPVTWSLINPFKIIWTSCRSRAIWWQYTHTHTSTLYDLTDGQL